MNGINPLKTYTFFYSPKINSNYSENIRNYLFENLNHKKLVQRRRIARINSNLKKRSPINYNINSRNFNLPKFFKDKINGTPNRSNNSIKKSQLTNIKDNSYRLNIVLPNMLNNYNKIKLNNKKDHICLGSGFNLLNNKYYFLNQLKDINIMNQNENIKEKKLNDYLNILSQNNWNNFDNINNINKENIESVEWMLYNRQKNKIKKGNSKNFLDELNNLQNYEEMSQINSNIHHLFEINNNNSFNEFKKKHSRDYLMFTNHLKNVKKKSSEVKDLKERDNYFNENESNKRMKKRKLIKYNVLSIPGSHKGIEKINQDYSLILPIINECNNVKLFGIFDGHGTYGDKISLEICKFFNDFFKNKEIYDEKLDILENNENNSIYETKNINNKIKCKKYYYYNNIYKSNKKDKNNMNEKEINYLKIKKTKRKNNNNKFKHLTQNAKKQNSLILSRFKTIKGLFNNIISKNKIIKSTYNSLSKDNYFQIYNSFKKIDKILHEKYTQNKMCDGSGTALTLLLVFNDYNKDKNNIMNFENNCNKIISTNLGNTKSLLITDDNKIKELNICHTPNIKEERIRIENHGGKIDRIDWLKVGPLRVWYQDKKYPGLTITRSLGDFEAQPLGILSIPDIKEFDIDEEKIKIIVIGTNGIWEFLSNEKVMDIALRFYDYGDIEGATQKIIEIAGKLWKIKNPNNIPDLTVIVLFFK